MSSSVVQMKDAHSHVRTNVTLKLENDTNINPY